MKLYTKQHAHYCDIDLHTRIMYNCILNQQEDIVLCRKFDTNPDIFLRTIQPFKEDMIVGLESIFTWYWLAALCGEEGIDFVLDHTL